MERDVGILGIATYLPTEIRTNAWWPQATVDRWIAERASASPPPPPDQPSEAMRRVMAAMSRQARDPFQGMVERHVMADAMTSLDMELEAARRALHGHDPGAVDLLLTHTPMPEWLGSNPGCRLHAALGLRPDCITTQVDASGNSFLIQVALAERLLATGRAQRALLVQSFVGSRLLDSDDVQSPLFGDGAAATLLGPVASPSLLGFAHRTDGSHPRALVATVRGGRWYDGGKISLHRGDVAEARQSFLETVDRATDVIARALAEANVAAADVDVFAAHQGTPWLREVTMEMAGLSRARFCDSFAHHGYLAGASVPFVLDEMQRTRVVQPGNLVVILGGGVGATIGAAVLRWTL